MVLPRAKKSRQEAEPASKPAQPREKSLSKREIDQTFATVHNFESVSQLASLRTFGLIFRDVLNLLNSSVTRAKSDSNQTSSDGFFDDLFGSSNNSTQVDENDILSAVSTHPLFTSGVPIAIAQQYAAIFEQFGIKLKIIPVATKTAVASDVSKQPEQLHPFQTTTTNTYHYIDNQQITPQESPTFAKLSPLPKSLEFSPGSVNDIKKASALIHRLRHLDQEQEISKFKSILQQCHALNLIKFESEIAVAFVETFFPTSSATPTIVTTSYIDPFPSIERFIPQQNDQVDDDNIHPPSLYSSEKYLKYLSYEKSHQHVIQYRKPLKEGRYHPDLLTTIDSLHSLHSQAQTNIASMDILPTIPLHDVIITNAMHQLSAQMQSTTAISNQQKLQDESFQQFSHQSTLFRLDAQPSLLNLSHTIQFPTSSNAYPLLHASDTVYASASSPDKASTDGNSAATSTASAATTPSGTASSSISEVSIDMPLHPHLSHLITSQLTPSKPSKSSTSSKCLNAHILPNCSYISQQTPALTFARALVILTYANLHSSGRIAASVTNLITEAFPLSIFRLTLQRLVIVTPVELRAPGLAMGSSSQIVPLQYSISLNTPVIAQIQQQFVILSELYFQGIYTDSQHYFSIISVLLQTLQQSLSQYMSKLHSLEAHSKSKKRLKAVEFSSYHVAGHAIPPEGILVSKYESHAKISALLRLVSIWVSSLPECASHFDHTLASYMWRTFSPSGKAFQALSQHHFPSIGLPHLPQMISRRFDNQSDSSLLQQNNNTLPTFSPKDITPREIKKSKKEPKKSSSSSSSSKDKEKDSKEKDKDKTSRKLKSIEKESAVVSSRDDDLLSPVSSLSELIDGLPQTLQTIPINNSSIAPFTNLSQVRFDSPFPHQTYQLSLVQHLAPANEQRMTHSYVHPFSSLVSIASSHFSIVFQSLTTLYITLVYCLEQWAHIRSKTIENASINIRSSGLIQPLIVYDYLTVQDNVWLYQRNINILATYLSLPSVSLPDPVEQLQFSSITHSYLSLSLSDRAALQRSVFRNELERSFYESAKSCLQQIFISQQNNAALLQARSSEPDQLSTTTNNLQSHLEDLFDQQRITTPQEMFAIDDVDAIITSINDQVQQLQDQSQQETLTKQEEIDAYHRRQNSGISELARMQQQVDDENLADELTLSSDDTTSSTPVTVTLPSKFKQSKHHKSTSDRLNQHSVLTFDKHTEDDSDDDDDDATFLSLLQSIGDLDDGGENDQLDENLRDAYFDDNGRLITPNATAISNDTASSIDAHTVSIALLCQPLIVASSEADVDQVILTLASHIGLNNSKKAQRYIIQMLSWVFNQKAGHAHRSPAFFRVIAAFYPYFPTQINAFTQHVWKSAANTVSTSTKATASRSALNQQIKWVRYLAEGIKFGIIPVGCAFSFWSSISASPSVVNYFILSTFLEQVGQWLYCSSASYSACASMLDITEKMISAGKVHSSLIATISQAVIFCACPELRKNKVDQEKIFFSRFFGHHDVLSQYVLYIVQQIISQKLPFNSGISVIHSLPWLYDSTTRPEEHSLPAQHYPSSKIPKYIKSLLQQINADLTSFDLDLYPAPCTEEQMILPLQRTTSEPEATPPVPTTTTPADPSDSLDLFKVVIPSPQGIDLIGILSYTIYNLEPSSTERLNLLVSFLCALDRNTLAQQQSPPKSTSSKQLSLTRAPSQPITSQPSTTTKIPLILPYLCDYLIQGMFDLLHANQLFTRSSRIQLSSIIGKLAAQNAFHIDTYFAVLYYILLYGFKQSKFGLVCPSDPPQDTFRISMLIELIKPCQTLLFSKLLQPRFEVFLLVFHRYLLLKQFIPAQMEVFVQDLFRQVQNNQQHYVVIDVNPTITCPSTISQSGIMICTGQHAVSYYSKLLQNNSPQSSSSSSSSSSTIQNNSTVVIPWERAQKFTACNTTLSNLITERDCVHAALLCPNELFYFVQQHQNSIALPNQKNAVAGHLLPQHVRIALELKYKDLSLFVPERSFQCNKIQSFLPVDRQTLPSQLSSLFAAATPSSSSSSPSSSPEKITRFQYTSDQDLYRVLENTDLTNSTYTEFDTILEVQAPQTTEPEPEFTHSSATVDSNISDLLSGIDVDALLLDLGPDDDTTTEANPDPEEDMTDPPDLIFHAPTAAAPVDSALPAVVASSSPVPLERLSKHDFEKFEWLIREKQNREQTTLNKIDQYHLGELQTGIDTTTMSISELEAAIESQGKDLHEAGQAIDDQQKSRLERNLGKLGNDYTRADFEVNQELARLKLSGNGSGGTTFSVTSATETGNRYHLRPERITQLNAFALRNKDNISQELAQVRFQLNANSSNSRPSHKKTEPTPAQTNNSDEDETESHVPFKLLSKKALRPDSHLTDLPTIQLNQDDLAVRRWVKKERTRFRVEKLAKAYTRSSILRSELDEVDPDYLADLDNYGHHANRQRAAQIQQVQHNFMQSAEFRPGYGGTNGEVEDSAAVLANWDQYEQFGKSNSNSSTKRR